MSAPLPVNEEQRLKALERYEILDTLPEEGFDRITQLVADTLNVPLAVINFVDRDRQWGKSCVGVDSTEAPREDSFCAWTILSDDVLIIQDVPGDERFRNNPMVTGFPHIHAYAGAPLLTPDGFRLGSLCVTDTQPREFTPQDARFLRRLAAMVVDELELRLRTRELERELQVNAQLVHELREANVFAETLAAVSALAECDLAPRDMARAVAEHLGRTTKVDWAGLIVESDGTLRQLTGFHRAGVSRPWDALMARVSERVLLAEGEPGLLAATGSVFVDDYTLHPQAHPSLIRMKLRSLAWLSLGEYDGSVFYFALGRLGRVQPWSERERQLLEAASRSVSVSLERREYARRMEAAAFTDHLTRLQNRRAFDRDVAALERSGTRYSLALIDLDGFKHVNDVLGHDQGDVLLRTFAGELRVLFRGNDGVYRVGGDEFALLLGAPKLRLDDEIRSRVASAVSALWSLGFTSVNASVGIAHSGEERGSAALWRAADERMYQEKRGRKPH